MKYVATMAAVSATVGAVDLSQAEEQNGVFIFFVFIACSWCFGIGPALIAPTLFISLGHLVAFGPNGLETITAKEVFDIAVITGFTTSVGIAGTLQRRSQRKKLEHSQMLEAQDLRKEQFLTLLAHELRNPLAPIRSGLQVLKIAAETPVEPAAVRRIHEMMERQVTHMTRLIEQYQIASKNNISGRITSGDHARVIPTGVHSFGNFISSKEFAISHPEYFGMDATGKRLTDDMGTPSAWTQLCVTNEDVRRITLEREKKFIAEERAAALKEGREASRMLVLSQNDNTTNLCLCPNCKAIADCEGSESGPQLEFVNHVARGLKDEFPDVLVQTEAYNFTLAAPKTIRPEANVVVRFCDNYGFSDPTHPLAHPRNERPMKLFAGWQDKQCKLGVWDYWRVFQQHPPGFFAPSSNVRALRDDMHMFHKSGVELMTIEAEDVFGAGIVNDFASADMQSFMPLRIWIGLKLIDDPNKNLDVLLDRFLQGYYGPAAQPMRALLERIEDRQAVLPIRVVDVQRHVWAEQFCDAAFFADAFHWLDEAMLATAADPLMQTHIQRERIIIDSAFLWLEGHDRASLPVVRHQCVCCG